MNNQYQINLKVLGKDYTVRYPAQTVAGAIDNAVMHIINNITVEHVCLDPRVHEGKIDVRVTAADKHKFVMFLRDKIKEYKFDKYKKDEEGRE
jgi:hypothetical protein